MNETDYKNNLPFHDIFQWARRQTTEQGEIPLEDYLWSPEIEELIFTLKQTEGNLIAVLGLQGTGKTITQRILESELPTTLQVKFTGMESLDKAFRAKSSRYEYWDEGFFETFLHQLHQYAGTTIHDIKDSDEQVLAYQVQNRLDKILKGMGNINSLFAKLILRQTIDPKDKKRIIEAMPRILKKLGKDFRKELIDSIRQDDMGQIKNYVFDFKDYNRKSKGDMNKHLRELQEWWKELYTLDSETSFWQDANITIFWQKELWKDDLFFGKWDTVEITPPTPQELVEYYERIWGTTAPFEDDALLKIASYARGIFRWYKKYIAHCMTKYYTRKTPDFITTQEVKEWLTIERMVKDWENELGDTFKSKTKIKRAIRTLIYLDENGETKNTELIDKIFHGDASACTRIIQKLEEKERVTTRKEGKTKLVKKV